MHRNTASRATTQAFLAYFFWGFSFYFTRLGLNTAQPFVLLAHRFTLAVLLLLVLMLSGVVHLHLRGKKLGLLLLLGLFEPVLYFVGEEYGLLNSSTIFSGIMIATIPIFVLAASGVFLKEKATPGQVIWSFVSIAGVIVIALQGSGNGTVTLKGALFLLLAVFGAVAYTILSRKLSADFSAFERTFVCMAEGAVAFWILAVIQCRADLREVVTPLASGQYWLCIGYLGCIASVVCYLCLNSALTHISANRIAIGTNLVTVITVIAGILFLHEPFSWVSVLACVIILVGIYGVVRISPAQEDDLLP